MSLTFAKRPQRRKAIAISGDCLRRLLLMVLAVY